MKTKYFFFTLAVLVLLALAGSVSAADSQIGAEPQDGGFLFIENRGQFDPQVRFQAQTANGTLWLTNDGLWVSMIEPAAEGAETVSGVALKLSFAGANPQPALEPFGLLETKMSYFLGNDPAKWVSDAPVWAGVRYVDLYPGLDLVLAGKQGQLAPKVVARDPAALGQVKLRVEGADGMNVADGQMLLATSLGELAMPLLVVEGAAAKLSPEVGMPEGAAFEVMAPFASSPAADEAMPLGGAQVTEAAAASATTVIFSTYLGGSSDEWPTGVAADDNRNTFVCGGTMSGNFPSTPGAYDTAFGGAVDVFISKYGPNGQWLATTLLGSGGYDSCAGVVVAGGIVYATGQADGGFPTIAPAFDTSHNGGYDVFVAKLNNTLNTLLASTYMGGGSADRGLDVVVDGNGNVYIVGDTYGGFPTTPGTAQPAPRGGRDGFVAKLNANLSTRLWATYLGGNNYEEAVGLGVRNGFSYVTGVTRSTNFPTLNAYDPTHNGFEDGFVTKLNANGGLVYSTFVGSAHNEWLSDVAVDSADQAHVVGYTSGNYPTTANAFQSTRKGDSDGVLTVLNAAGNGLVYSTLFGGTGDEDTREIAIDDEGNDYIIGTTMSADLPTRDPYQPTKKGGRDAFLAELQPIGAGGPLSLLYGTYLGGSGDEAQSNGVIALDGKGYTLLSGTTNSKDFPILNAADDSYNGSRDVFVTKLVLPAPYVDGEQNLLGISGWMWGPGTVGVNGALTNGVLSINAVSTPARACWYQDMDGVALRNTTVRLEAEMSKNALMNQLAPPFTNPYISLQVRKGDGSWIYNFGGILNSRSVPGGPWIGEARDILLPNDMTTLRAAFCVWNATQGTAQARSLALRRTVAPPPPHHKSQAPTCCCRIGPGRPLPPV